jgi:hypothetical protein
MKRKSRREKTYICVVCGRSRKAKRKVKCCGKEMLAKDKGSWNL